MGPSFLSWETPEGETIILTIIEYMESELFLPDISWPDDMFEKQSFSRWAAEDILQGILDRPYDMPETVVEDYIITMSYYARNYSGIAMFQIALNTAKEILALIQ